MAADLISGGISVLSGILGNIFGGGEQAAAQELLQQAYDKINAVGAPPELASKIILDHFQQAGMYTPELEQAVNLGMSKVAQIQENPNYKQAQNEALQLIGSRARTGLTPEDRAAFNQLRRETAQQAEGKRQQILQEMKSRGLAGSGAELAAQLSNAQASDQDLSAQGDRLAAAASQNALQALGQYSNAANQARGQDFDIAQAKASAEDDFSKFNVQNQINRQQRNIASQNQGQQLNLGNKQDIMNQNTNVNNQQTLGQLAQKQQDYFNKLNYAQQQAKQLANQANVKLGNAPNVAQQWTNIGGGLVGLINTYGSNKAQPNTPSQPQASNQFEQLTNDYALTNDADKKKKSIEQGLANYGIA